MLMSTYLPLLSGEGCCKRTIWMRSRLQQMLRQSKSTFGVAGDTLDIDTSAANKQRCMWPYAFAND